LVYTFSKRLDGLVRDSSGNRHHAVVAGQLGYTDSAAGTAAVFDGACTLTAAPAPQLAMTNQLTVDVWVKSDEFTAQQCVLDKGGERYRIALTANGGFFFGLKDGRNRADLPGKGLIPGQWHRITGVFQRPDLDLYLDGQRVASKKWDHDVGPGGRLHIAAKAGRLNYFRGEIDRIHIYPYARPPQAGDETRYADTGGKTMANTLKTTETEQTFIVDTGAIRATLSRSTGAIVRLTAGAKTLVDEPQHAPLFCQVLESSAYEGLTDFAPGKTLEASWKLDKLALDRQLDGQVRAIGTGHLVLLDNDALQAQISYTFSAGSRHVRVQVKLTPQGTFANRFLRSVGYRQPLALNQRKRVVQAGDQGIRWDVRHHYQFHTHVRFMAEPDHNWWRHFHIDQNTNHSYTMWRAESRTTSALVSFRGRQAPGYMSAYDQQGGALFAYQAIAERAPKQPFYRLGLFDTTKRGAVWRQPQR